MLTAANIYIQYGDRILLDHVSLTIGDRDRVGLVGRNGAGKSTILHLLSGHMSPDEGTIQIPSGRTVGYLRQEISFSGERSVREETMHAFDELRQMEQRLDDINDQLATRTDYESDSYHKLIEELSALSERLQHLGSQTAEASVERVLKGLGYQHHQLDQPTRTFSGGWQMRVELAKLLLQQPDYLLLDEPTNHLDIESILWLEDYLKDYPGAIIVISHDQQFLDHVTQRTIEVELGQLYDYKAPYTRYRQLRAERREKLQSAYENQQRVIANKERTINRFMAKANKTKMAQSMQKQLDKIERIEMDQVDSSAMRLQFQPAPRSGDIVVAAKNLTKQYGDKEVLRNVNFQLQRAERVAFVGQNGQGKTTLARLLINELDETSGTATIGHNVAIGYYAQNQTDQLDPQMTLLETLEEVAPADMRTKLRGILGSFLFSGEDVDKKVYVLSGGERARLALAKMIMFPYNLLVLDEPTNHLDIRSKEVLKQALQAYDGALIVVSHDREFLTDLTSRTVEFRDHKLINYLGDINYFLQQRKAQDMREVELRTKADAAAKKPASTVDQQARQRLQKAVKNAENKITKLEKTIQAIEKQMAEPGFYESDEVDRVTADYRQQQAALEAAMEKWEAAHEELEALTG